MQDRRGEIGSADATSSISPKVFLFASFLELSNQLLAEVLAHESASVEDREAAYLAALGRFGEMADSSRRGRSCLNKARSSFSVSAGVMILHFCMPPQYPPPGGGCRGLR